MRLQLVRWASELRRQHFQCQRLRPRYWSFGCFVRRRKLRSSSWRKRFCSSWVAIGNMRLENFLLLLSRDSKLEWNWSAAISKCYCDRKNFNRSNEFHRFCDKALESNYWKSFYYAFYYARSVDTVAKCRKQVLLIVEFTPAHFIRLCIVFPEVRFGFIIASLHELLIEVYEKISGFSQTEILFVSVFHLQTTQN